MITQSNVFIPTHLTESELNFLLDTASNLEQESIIVEVGSYLGASTYYLAKGISKKGGRVYAVDTWSNLAMSEGAKDTYQEFMENTNELKDFIVPLRGLSIDISQEFNKKIDLLFIDGDHSYEGVMTDLESWLPKLKNGGIIIFHDYSWAEGVQKAIKEKIIPIQINWGRRLDLIYWTKINHKQINRRKDKITVVIPTYNRTRSLIKALHSVINQKTTYQFEILILDNASEPQLEHKVIKIAETTEKIVKYIPVPEIGLHNGRNTAAIQAQGDIIVYIDDDVIIPSDWLQKICEVFNDPDVAGVGGKVIPQWETSPPDWVQYLPPCYFSLLDKGDKTIEMNYPDTPYGCNMAYRRNVILGHSGFPPDGVGGGKIEWKRGDGETGFAKKLYDQGYKIVYCGEAWLYHCIPESRLTLDYVKNRTMKGAISNFYTQQRIHNYGYKRLLAKSLFNSLKFIIFYFAYIVYFFDSEKKIHYLIKKTATKITALYQIRLIFDSDLRNWVSRPEYLSSIIHKNESNHQEIV